jgi:hypothetical protein
MTNHIPNDLSHLSEAEFNALCPQGEHAPGPQPISPAAQAIEEAVDNAWSNSRARAAAALRVVADQVVPPEEERLFNEERPWDGELCAVVEIRQQLLAIAAELAGHA